MPDPGPAPQPDGGMGLEKKLGPLPRWAWIGLTAAAAVVGLVWWRSRKSAQPTDSTATSGNSGEAEGLATEQYESLLAILRDLQGKTSTPIPEPGDTGGDDTSSTATVEEGTWLSEFLAKYPGLTEEKLRQLNPNLRILWANDNGYIDAKRNPGPKVRLVINTGNAPAQVKVK